MDQEEIHRKCYSNNINKRREAVRLLKLNFGVLSYKQKAWENLHRLTLDKDSDVRSRVVEAIGAVFQYIPDKEKAWEDLSRLTSDESSTIRWETIGAIGAAFQYVLDKERAWEDLCRLISDEDSGVRSRVAEVLGTVFQYVPFKEKAWEDLHILTLNEDSGVRWETTEAIGTVFKYIPNKEQAWEDFCRLTSDEDSSVRSRVAEAIGTVFQHIPDKEQAREKLNKLTFDKDSYVRVNAYHSLGRISIYKASQSESEEAYIRELENSINFFEKSFEDQSFYNPSIFCLPLYRSFYSMICTEKQQVKGEGEAEKYLKEAKNAIEGSEDRRLLFEAVQNLANALNEVQNLENIDLEVMKKELSFYRKYCEQAAELMNNTEEGSPFATEVMRKGLPILDRKLKSLLVEIQEKAEALCRESLQTSTEEIACAVSKEVQKWEIGTQEEMSLNVENLVFALESNIPRISDNQYIFDLIQQITEQKDIAKQYSLISFLISSSIPTIKFSNLNKMEGTLENSSEFEEFEAEKRSSDACDYSTVDEGLNAQIEMLREHCGSIKENKRAQFLKMLEETKKMNVKGKLESIPKIYGYAANNRIFPFIEKIPVSSRAKEVVKIATVQLCYKLSEEFPYQVKTEHKEVIKQKIQNILNIANREEVDILCLPELCISEDLIPEIRNSCRKMIVIAGTYYDDGNRNLCKIVMNSDAEIPPQFKIIPSDFERSDITEQKMIPGKKILNLYETQFGKFAVLICRDFGNFTSTLKGKVDLIFVPSYNSANKRFHDYAHLHVEDSPSYIIISNTAKYGGTAIFGRIRGTFYPSLELKGYKQKGDKTFKLCEINKGEEGMIIADFNLLHKSFLIPTPIDPEEDITPVENIRRIPI